LEDDLRQRDFTINAMAVDFDLNLIDPFGGSDDLKNGTLKFVDDMDKAISADPIRMLRYFRFSSKIGSNIDVGFSRQDLVIDVKKSY
jgi:tRNA nucleotidyltransferase/poly(A) polymerase